MKWAQLGLILSISGMLAVGVGCGNSTQQPPETKETVVSESSNAQTEAVSQGKKSDIRSRGLHTSINNPGQRVSLDTHIESGVKTVFEFYGDW